jgi:hypothetical protein
VSDKLHTGTAQGAPRQKLVPTLPQWPRAAIVGRRLRLFKAGESLLDPKTYSPRLRFDLVNGAERRTGTCIIRVYARHSKRSPSAGARTMSFRAWAYWAVLAAVPAAQAARPRPRPRRTR